MKKCLIFCLAALCLIFVLCSCDSASSNAGGGKINTEEASEVLMFVKPADAVSLDLTKEDPSTDQMILKYDEQGRVSQCYYSIEGKEAYANYDYGQNDVEIITFLDAIVVDDIHLQLSEFDANKGFSIIEGYYFKGFSVE